MSVATSRRGILGALTILPAAAMAPALRANTSSGPTQISPTFEQAIAYQRRASAVAQRYADAVHMPAYEAWQADAARIPHIVTSNSFAAAKGEQVALSTADQSSVETSRRVLANIDAGQLPFASIDYIATLRELVDATEAREKERERLMRHHRIDATGERCDQLTDAALEAIDAAVAIPAQSVADLAAKIAFVSEVDWWDVAEARDAISSDARRLAGEGR